MEEKNEKYGKTIDAYFQTTIGNFHHNRNILFMADFYHGWSEF